MVFLLEIDRLWRFSVELDLQAPAICRDREIAIAEPPDQVEGLLRRLLVRQTQRVLRHALFDRRPHLRRRAEEAVRRHQPRETLMGTLEIVAVHKQ
jgi:hypothetical protein